MNDFEHIQTVKAGIQSFIAFIIRCRMKHAVIHQNLIISVQHLTHKEKVRLQLITETP